MAEDQEIRELRKELRDELTKNRDLRLELSEKVQQLSEKVQRVTSRAGIASFGGLLLGLIGGGGIGWATLKSTVESVARNAVASHRDDYLNEVRDVRKQLKDLTTQVETDAAAAKKAVSRARADAEAAAGAAKQAVEKELAELAARAGEGRLRRVIDAAVRSHLGGVTRSPSVDPASIDRAISAHLAKRPWQYDEESLRRFGIKRNSDGEYLSLVNRNSRTVVALCTAAIGSGSFGYANFHLEDGPLVAMIGAVGNGRRGFGGSVVLSDRNGIWFFVGYDPQGNRSIQIGCPVFINGRMVVTR